MIEYKILSGNVFYVPKDNKQPPEDYDCAMQIMNGEIVRFDPFISSNWSWGKRHDLLGRNIEISGWWRRENRLDIFMVKENGLKIL